MTSRDGYAADFLGPEVPLPRPADDRPLRDLAYPHFSVLLDPARRLAVSTGVNIDGSSLRDVPRSGDWHLDPRVPAGEQAGNELYRDNDYDRGHLVRRRDPGWGAPDRARAATEATFAYPNAAPQAAAFNQSPELWVGLEDHVLAYAEANGRRVSVFTAPALAPDDPVYRGILIPRRFWKVAAWNAADPGESPRLAAAGFVLDQTAMLVRTAVPPFAGFRTFQVPIADIGELAGVDLGPLVAADVARATLRAPEWMPLTSLSQVVLA